MKDKFRDFEIGEFREPDFEQTAKVFRDVYIQTYPHFDKRFHRRERFRKILREHVLPVSNVRTAKYKGELVGFIALTENFIEQLYIVSEFQNAGLGSFWVEQAKNIYPDLLELYTFECNKRAVVFYEKHGFEVIERGIAPDEKMPDMKMRWTARI